MIKKLVVLLACFGLVHLSACTSNDQKKSDAEVTSDFDSADLEKLDGEESSLDVAADNSLASDQLPEDALGETTTTTTQTTTTQAATEDHHAEPSVATHEALPADPFAEQNTMEATPEPTMESTTVVDSAPPAEPESTTMVESTTSTKTETSHSYAEEKPKKASVPLQKVATAPWKVGKVWYNTVYFARPGDNLSSISTMIYGKGNKVSELKKGNPSYQGRGVKPGDKVYYNSPHRSDDSGRLLTYYEDNGVAPETYVAKEGDDIKKISKNLLGYKDAWKEVWASNSVDSKGSIAAGTELRYWKGGAVAAAPVPEMHQEIAAAPPAPHQEMAPPAEMPMEQHADMPPPPQQADNMDMPPPPPDAMGGHEMAPPPPPPDMAQEMAPPPPPPPPVEAVNPPAPVAAHHQEQGEESTLHGMDNDTTLALAVVGLAAAGLAILIVVRKKRRQKELEQHMDNTHVG